MRRTLLAMAVAFGFWAFFSNLFSSHSADPMLLDEWHGLS